MDRVQEWSNGEDEENEEAGFARLGEYFRLFRALKRAPSARTPRDLIEIRQAVETVGDPCCVKLEDPVKAAIVQRLTLEEFAAGQEIFTYGDPGDKLFMLWSGQVQVEVPRGRSDVDDGVPADMVKGPCYTAGQEFGELGLFEHVKKRRMRLTAVQPTQLLLLSEEDFRWCQGFSQESFVHERVNFLRTADRATLGEVPEAELQSMAARLCEEHYMGEQVVLKQGAEVDKAIWVKSGFCKVIRHVNPRFREAFDLYANKTPPPANPFAPTSGPSTEVVEDQPQPGPGAQEFRRLLQQFALDDGRGRAIVVPRRTTHRQRTGRSAEPDAAACGGGAAGAGGSSSSSSVPARNRKQPSTQATPRPPPRRPSDAAPGACSSAVVVDVLQEGRSFGVMEMMEGLDYQCSVVADPWVEIYVIKKNDLIRNTSKNILHKLFCDYQARLTDERIISQLKQNQRWNNYKKGLIEDIRNRRTNSSIIDRRMPRPRLAGVGDLRQEDYERIGNGEKMWDTGGSGGGGASGAGAPGALTAGARVQLVGLKRRAEMNGLPGTLVEQKDADKWVVRLDDDQTEKLFKAAHLEEIPDEVKYVFDVRCSTDQGGAKKLEVEWERRDASMAQLEKRIVMAVATASFREKIRRKQRRSNYPNAKDSEDAAAGASVVGVVGVDGATVVAAEQAAGQGEQHTQPRRSGHHTPDSGSESSETFEKMTRVGHRGALMRTGNAVVTAVNAADLAAALSPHSPTPASEQPPQPEQHAGHHVRIDEEARRRLLCKRSTELALTSTRRSLTSARASLKRHSKSPPGHGGAGRRANTVRFTHFDVPVSARGSSAGAGRIRQRASMPASAR